MVLVLKDLLSKALRSFCTGKQRVAKGFITQIQLNLINYLVVMLESISHPNVLG